MCDGEAESFREAVFFMALLNRDKLRKKRVSQALHIVFLNVNKAISEI